MEVTFEQAALRFGTLLRDLKAESVAVLDLREAHIWADFFVIATISSGKQASGFEGKILEAAKEMNIEQYRTVRKSPDGDEWKLLDFGSIVVHLMSPTARKFYDLERLWFDRPNLLKEQS
nr:ribosome silencing factor [uncultured Treponema sp.]